MNTVQLDVVSSEDSLFSGQVAFVVIPTEMGEIGVYPKHEPLLGRVRPGVLRIKQDDRSEEILLAVSGGVVEIQPDCITVLSEIALRSDELDEQQAQKAKEEAEKMLAREAQDGVPGSASAEARLAAAIAQLKAVEYIRQRERR